MPATACFPHMDFSRRTLLAAAAAGTAGITGCLDGAFGGTDGERSPTDGEASPMPTDRDLSNNCPTTQDLGVEWPAELTESSVGTFVESSEDANYREVVVGYEPETTIDEYGLTARISDGPTTVDGGYEATLSGGGGVYEPPLHLRAGRADAPSDANVVPIDEVTDEGVRGLPETAAAEGEAETTSRRTASASTASSSAWRRSRRTSRGPTVPARPTPGTSTSTGPPSNSPSRRGASTATTGGVPATTSTNVSSGGSRTTRATPETATCWSAAGTHNDWKTRLPRAPDGNEHGTGASAALGHVAPGIPASPSGIRKVSVVPASVVSTAILPPLCVTSIRIIQTPVPRP